MNTRFVFMLIISAFIFQCQTKKSNEKATSSGESAENVAATYRLEQVWASDTLLKTPESVIFDQKRGVIYVSNVNMNPWEKDNNGFISRLSEGGEIMDLEWISGMSGPKGMAIVNDMLFVADLDELVLIDLENGKISSKIQVEGASGLNDITPGNDNDLYISDSNAGKIFRYADGKVSVFHDDAPGRPNGLLMDQGKLLTAFSQTSEFLSYDPVSLEKTVIATGIGAGDGVTPTNNAGVYLVSDWNGEIFVIGTDGFKQSVLDTKEQKKNTADIWFIPEKSLVLVPTFFDNRVVAYTLKR